jgi:16S rRNA (cytidine1402-2'-O)-methyltransferase
MKGSSRERSSEPATGASERSLPHENAQNLDPGLYIVATPIGNARDLTLRALDVLKGCDVIAAEDTRVTSKLLAIHGVSKPLTAYNDHNAPRERPRLLSRLHKGDRVALVSDAGTPLVSDPGYKLVREALAEGLPVHVIPGPSAALSALAVSGLPTDRFLFAGFLPAKAGPRRQMLEELGSIPATLIFFESPQRLPETIAAMQSVLRNRQAVVARELTKLHEEIRRGDLASLAAMYATEPLPKGEITLVVAPPLEAEPNFPAAERLLAKLLPHMRVGDAADAVSEALDVPRRAVYERALAMKDADAHR